MAAISSTATPSSVHLGRPRPGSTRGWRSVSTRTPTRGPTRRTGAARHPDGMSMNMYLINAILVLMVIRQIREHSLDLRALAVPVLAVAAAAVMFLHSVPVGGNDIALELLGVTAGAPIGPLAAPPPPPPPRPHPPPPRPPPPR